MRFRVPSDGAGEVVGRGGRYGVCQRDREREAGRKRRREEEIVTLPHSPSRPITD